MGARPGCGRTETAVDESRKETAVRVARYQTDNIVGRTCCGCLEDAFGELRFSCPFLSLLVVLLLCLPSDNVQCVSIAKKDEETVESKDA